MPSVLRRIGILAVSVTLTCGVVASVLPGGCGMRPVCARRASRACRCCGPEKRCDAPAMRGCGCTGEPSAPVVALLDLTAVLRALPAVVPETPPVSISRTVVSHLASENPPPPTPPPRSQA